MGDNAILAHGTKFAIWDPAANSGSGAYVDVAEVLDINGPGISKETVDTTSHSSTWRDHIGTIPDGGEISFDINYDPADSTHQLLRNAISASGKQKFQITFTDASTATFEGTVTGFEIGAPVADKLTASITVKVGGPVTFA